MPSTDSGPSPDSGRLAPDSLDALVRIHWTAYSGFTGRLAPEYAIEDHVVAEVVLDHLSLRDQDVLLLRLEKDLPFAEVGRRIGVSEEAARMRFQRAKLKIFAG